MNELILDQLLCYLKCVFDLFAISLAILLNDAEPPRSYVRQFPSFIVSSVAAKIALQISFSPRYLAIKAPDKIGIGRAHV